MTIASEIARIKSNIADAYTACEAHGATMPAVRNSANLVNCVETCKWGFPYEITEQGVLQKISKPYKFRFPPSATSFGFYSNAFTTTFVNDTNLVEIDFGNLSKILKCNGCTSLVTVKANGVTASMMGGTLLGAFNGCTSLKNVELKGLVSAGSSSSVNGGLQNTFINCTSLENVIFEALTTIINQRGSSPAQPFGSTFQNCTSLKNVYFSAVTTITNYSFSSMLSGCSGVNVYFNSLQTVSGTSPFRSIFSSASNCTIHFPSNKSFDVTSVGGTNCQVLYDLPAVLG